MKKFVIDFQLYNNNGRLLTVEHDYIILSKDDNKNSILFSLHNQLPNIREGYDIIITNITEWSTIPIDYQRMLLSNNHTSDITLKDKVLNSIF